jgi:hypothetical protein
LLGCKFPVEYWTVITLQPRPDGTLAGQYRAWESNCETERTVTFTRIGDVDLNSLPDPASQPVRVTSPATAWHGHYRITQTPDGLGPVGGRAAIQGPDRSQVAACWLHPDDTPLPAWD